MQSRQLQQAYLNALGIQSWQLKDAPVEDEPEDLDGDVLQTAEQPVKTESVPVPMKQVEPIIQPEPEPEDIVSEAPIPLDSDSELAKKIQQCHTCQSRSQRLNTLAGQGSETSSIFFISDAPDADEDRAGHYLSESSAMLFSAMTDSIGITQDYFYTGIVKCHSLQDFVVSEADIEHCSAFLAQQIIQLKPELIVILGINPARALLQTVETFTQLRGQIHKLVIAGNEYPVLVSYHPTYLIRNPLYKREAMADLIQIKQYLHGPV